MLAETTYKPYGDLETGAYSSDAVRNFEGKERQRSTSGVPAIALYYFGGRFYDAQLGMFIQPDPAMQNPSPYLYCGGDPINRIDPTGLVDETDMPDTPSEWYKQWAQQRSAMLGNTIVGSPITSAFLQMLISATASQSTNPTFQSPVKAKTPTVTEKYGKRVNPITGKEEDHRAVDLRNGKGDPVYATEDGLIKQVDKTSNGTNFVIVEGNISGDYIGYYHTTSTVTVGTKVSGGQAIGVTDMSGRSTGPHLHFTVQTNISSYSTRYDPLIYFNNYGILYYYK